MIKTTILTEDMIWNCMKKISLQEYLDVFENMK